MTVQQLIDKLERIEDKEREIYVVIGNEDETVLSIDITTLLSVHKEDEAVELFCDDNFKEYDHSR